MDLYELLKVARDADAEDVKTAYRRRVKETHPDTGGDASEFVRVNTAYEVLSDPERRTKYDQTGTIDETVIDAELQKAHAVIGEMLNNAVSEVASLTIEDPKFYGDILAIMRNNIRTKIDGVEKAKAKAALVLRNLEKFCSRFSTVEGKANFLALGIEASMRNVTDGNKRADADLAVLNKALELLDPCSFRVDQSVSPLANVYGQQTNTTGFSFFRFS